MSRLSRRRERANSQEGPKEEEWEGERAVPGIERMSKSFSNVSDVSPTENGEERKVGQIDLSSIESPRLIYPLSTSPPPSPSSFPSTRFSYSQEKTSRFDKLDRHSFPSKKNSPFSHNIPHFSKKRKEKSRSMVGGFGEREVEEMELEEMGKEFYDSVSSHFDCFEPAISQFSVVCHLLLLF